MNSEDQTIANVFKSSREVFRETLQSFLLLDLGTILNIDTKTGRATVQGNQVVGGIRAVYKNVEVIYPGNPQGVFKSACSGSSCLIFAPATCIPNIQDNIIRMSSPSYSAEGIKVLPIGNGSTPRIQAVMDSSGSFSIIGPEHEVIFEGTYVESTHEGISSVSHDMDGGFTLTYKGQNTGPLSITINESGITQNIESKTGAVKWTDTIDTDGVRTLSQVDGNEEELCTIKIDADGTLHVSSAQSIQLNGDQHHLVSWEELDKAMQKLYTALTTTPIIGNGSPQSTWTGITSIDISAAKASSLLTDD